jgi:phospholipase/lecithinase/hemolysin
MPSCSKPIAIAALALGLLPGASAGTIDAIFAFGDSLSDAGNVFAASGGTIPPAPYFDGQFSNGPVWLQTLATGLGLAPLTPSLKGGTDYAYGSGEIGNLSFDTANAQTDLLGPTGQLAQFLAVNPVADPNALYTIWIGSNDLSDIPPGSTPAQIAADIGAMAANVDAFIGALAADGARNFLVVTVPDLGKTPAAIAGGPAVEAAASALAAGFDTTLVNGSGPIPSLSSLAALDGLNLQVLNAYGLLDAVVANPLPYGFTDVTDPCLVGVTVCATPNQYLFWDGQHPTAAGHALVGDAALQLEAPEPVTLPLVGTGLLALILLRRRAQA